MLRAHIRGAGCSRWRTLSTPVPALPEYFQELAAQQPRSPSDQPPAAPAGAYPAPNGANVINPFDTKARVTTPTDPKLRNAQDVVAPAIQYHLHVHSTRNNTIVTFCNAVGNPVAYYTGGTCGFKGVNRSGYEAGYQCAVRVFDRIMKEVEGSQTALKIDLYFKGFGMGRDALYRALMATEGEKVRPLIARVTDRTAIKIGGTRAKKARRL